MQASLLKGKLFVCDANESNWTPKVIGAVDFRDNPVCILHIRSLLSLHKHTMLMFFTLCFLIILSLFPDSFASVYILFLSLHSETVVFS